MWEFILGVVVGQFTTVFALSLFKISRGTRKDN